MSMRDVARAVFRFAAAVEPKAADAAPRSPVDPRHLARAGLLAARFGAELLDALRKGPEVSLAYAELDDKVRAFHLFETVVAGLELPQAALDPAAAIETARRRLGHEQAVWASEGIGYELAERRRRAGGSVQGLLRGPDAGVPPGSWTVLHTGMGMALAEAALPRLASSAKPALLARAVADHVALCGGAARPGYAALAFEPLGLVLRLLEPKLVAPAAAALAELGEPWRDLFWHGVGRGLYFLPANLPPARSAPWKGLAASRAEPPDASGRLNAAAGFAWAVTLVNLRRPEIVESFLGHHADPRDARDPVRCGVVSALALWHAATGGSKDLRRFVGHVAIPERRALWSEAVRAPFAAAVAGLGHADGAGDPRQVAELFRYR